MRCSMSCLISICMGFICIRCDEDAIVPWTVDDFANVQEGHDIRLKWTLSPEKAIMFAPVGSNLTFRYYGSIPGVGNSNVLLWDFRKLEWTSFAKNIAGDRPRLTEFILTVQNASQIDEGVYTCQYASLDSRSDEKEIYLHVNSDVTPTPLIWADNIHLGESLTLTCDAQRERHIDSRCPTVSFRWYKDGDVLDPRQTRYTRETNISQGFLDIIRVGLDDNQTRYQCSVYNNASGTWSNRIEEFVLGITDVKTFVSLDYSTSGTSQVRTETDTIDSFHITDIPWLFQLLIWIPSSAFVLIIIACVIWGAAKLRKKFGKPYVVQDEDNSQRSEVQTAEDGEQCVPESDVPARYDYISLDEVSGQIQESRLNTREKYKNDITQGCLTTTALRKPRVTGQYLTTGISHNNAGCGLYLTTSPESKKQFSNQYLNISEDLPEDTTK